MDWDLQTACGGTNDGVPRGDRRFNTSAIPIQVAARRAQPRKDRLSQNGCGALGPGGAHACPESARPECAPLKRAQFLVVLLRRSPCGG